MNSEMSVLMILYCFVIIALTLWPLLSSYWLLKNRDRLTDPVFEEKYKTLYQGMKYNSFRALAYNAVFSVRRFDIIFINIYFTSNSPLSGIGDRT